jgi:H+/Cl- antiporter ClcA
MNETLAVRFEAPMGAAVYSIEHVHGDFRWNTGISAGRSA